MNLHFLTWNHCCWLVDHHSRQFIATKPPRSPQKVVKSKGILPKMAETFRLRIDVFYNQLLNCPDPYTAIHGEHFGISLVLATVSLSGLVAPKRRSFSQWVSTCLWWLLYRRNFRWWLI